jgi:general secretion pathway protein K
MRRAEDGYAILAAVAALMVFATVAYGVLAAERGDVEELRGQLARAHLEAAADAGLAKAVEGLAIDDPARRWPIDRRPQTVDFEGARLTITVEDERGKLPLSELTSAQVRALFAAAGASGDRLDILVDSFQDWLEGGGAPRPNGAKDDWYRPQGIAPRGAAPLTIDELARIRGMDPLILARIKPLVTTWFGASGAFDSETATPLAREIHAAADGSEAEMSSDAAAVPEDEARPAIEISDEGSLAGRSLTVVVRAQDASGETLTRRTVVSLTGRSRPAYYVIAKDD